MKENLDNSKNDELDNHFRNSLEKYDIPYDEDDWKKMQSKLDKSPPPLGGSREIILRLAALGALVIIMAWAWWWVDKPEMEVDFRSPVQETLGDSPENNPQEDDSNNTGNIEGEKATEKTPPSIISDQSRSLDAYRINDKESSGNRPTSIEDHDTMFEDGGRSFPLTEEKTTSDLNDHVEQEFSPLLEIVSEEQDQEADQDAQKQEGKPKSYSRFSTTLILAPDVSAMRISDIRGLGNNVGINLEYFVRENLSINTGVLYSFKTYKASYESYDGYQPDSYDIKGDCFILDIPINLRYYLNPAESLQRWYLSTGVSSYLMMTEKYQVEQGTGSTIAPSEVRIDNKNNHYLGIMNLSVGYERKLTEKWNIMIEPYVKLPLSGIGEYDVDLKSLGVWIGMKYAW